MLPKENPKIQAQLNYASGANIPFAIIFGSSELQSGKLKLKDLATAQQEEFDRSQMVAFLKKKIDALPKEF
jgi:histidyl-tRNA synthetase